MSIQQAGKSMLTGILCAATNYRVMKAKRLNLRTSTIFTVTLLLLFTLFASLVLTEITRLNAISLASGLLMLVLVANGALVIHMAQTGRIKAKGAKNRHKKLLPVFYKRKSPAAFSGPKDSNHFPSAKADGNEAGGSKCHEAVGKPNQAAC
jgi:hypothetical protein